MINNAALNEFSLIDSYFKKFSSEDSSVFLGIGDDAAGVRIPSDHGLVVSMDTLVADIHFPMTYDPFDLAWRAVMVNISDLAAMAATPKWALLALTLPKAENQWLLRFSNGLHAALKQFNMSLIGGDTTQGPLTITLTVHGLIPHEAAIKRSGACAGDVVFVTGELGAAALAYSELFDKKKRKLHFSTYDEQILLQKFYYPVPRVDFAPLLRLFASSAIDISDGLSADLNHICRASHVGALIDINAIPIHPIVKHYIEDSAYQLALSGGDDYELCFTVPADQLPDFYRALEEKQLTCYPIGVIESTLGLRQKLDNGRVISLTPAGYSHF